MVVAIPLLLMSCMSNLENNTGGNGSLATTLNLMHTSIRNTNVQKLSDSIVSRTAYKAIKDLSSCFNASSDTENIVLSPSSYILATTALASVSDNFDNASFGLNSDAIADVGEFLNGWNFEYENAERGDYSYFKSAILHQQVGSRYAFDDKKREVFNKEHVSTMVSSSSACESDAQTFFRDEIGLELEIPNLDVGEGVVTYGALKIKDYVANGLSKKDCLFTDYTDKQVNVSSYSFGSEKLPKTLAYYKGKNYQSFEVKINYTSLLIVLPDEESDISNIDPAEAYKDYLDNKDDVSAYGYIPFFHVKTEGKDLTETFKNNLSGKETFCSKLLKDDVINDLDVSKVIQSSDFEFNEYGVTGESVTAIVTDGSAQPGSGTPIELNVNRPFYAISLKDSFPLFVSKVINP